MDAVHPASLLHGTKGMLSHRTRGSVILRLLPRPPRCPHPYLDHRGAWLNPPSSTPHRLSLSTVTHPPPPTHQEDDFYSMNFISCPAPTLSPLYTQHPVLCLAPHGDSDPFFFFFFGTQILPWLQIKVSYWAGTAPHAISNLFPGVSAPLWEMTM